MNYLLLQEQMQPEMNMWIFMGLAAIALIVFSWLPNRKKRKQEEKFMEGLNKGSNVVTSGQIHAKIVKLEEHALVLEVESGARMRVSKSGISKDFTEQFYKKE